MKKLARIICCSAFAIATLCSTTPASESIADALGWKPGSSSDHKCGVCGGYYSEPKALKEVPHPPNYKKVPVVITAKGPVIFRTNGESILQDNVVVKQPGRIAYADKAIIFRNAKAGKITDIKLIGHVRIEEEGKLLVGKTADYNVAKNSMTVNGAVYHITGEHELLTVTTPFDAWGKASTIHRDTNGVISMKNATYSTCPPKNPSWVITAKSIKLDRKKGVGTAKNVVMRFKKVPIFYLPYYSFPLNHERKSGVLSPSAGYLNGTGQTGFYVSLPYYVNLAPNYDFLITTTWYSSRGLQYNGMFRYLTGESDGFLYASFLPDDRQFAAFRQTTLNTVVNYPSADAVPYFSQLSNNTNNRAFIDFENHIQFNQFWTAKLYGRYLSDAYYAEDFPSEYLSQTTNHIPSFAELNYAGSHWNDTFLLQSYQTLHPLDQFSSPAQNQYTRLPELDFNADYPQFSHHFDFDLSAQAVNFDYESAFVPYTYQMPVGERLHFAPSISRPFNWASFFLTPQLTADSTSYFAQLATTQNAPRQTYDINRTLPIFDIDSGMYFNRFIEVDHKHYIQTLEPRIFYLYTPYLNQNNYPNFDTQALPFSITNLYSLNQFTGFDRIQNANQVSFGLTSNVMRANDASDVLTAQLGLIDYFTTPDVCLTQTCTQPPSESISPITGALTWNPNALWSVLSQAAWDTTSGQVNNAQIGVQYHFLTNHLIVLNYQFAHANPDAPFDGALFDTNSSLVTAGLVWPISMRWNFFGYTYYDVTNHHAQSQYVGLSYSTCCWALRFITSQDYNGTTSINGGPAFQNTYTTNYYVEFMLKGLGSTGSSAENILLNTLPGFQDVFSNKGHYQYDNDI